MRRVNWLGILQAKAKQNTAKYWNYIVDLTLELRGVKDTRPTSPS